MRERWRHGLTRSAGPEIHFVEYGAGPLVVLLHGFPDFWYLWRHQIPKLAAAGLRVAAIDMRGYNRSDKPRGRRNYRQACLADDVTRVIAELGETSAHVVGHDWGGIVAWHLALTRPEWIDRLVVINAPHPHAFKRALRHMDQLRRSWYVAAFQIPLIPEATFARTDFAALKGVWKGASRNPGSFTDIDLVRYMQAFRRPGVLTAAINYYRALPLDMLSTPRTAPFVPPTRVIWGKRDPYLRAEITAEIRKLVPDAEIQILAEAGHWPMLDEPDLVSESIAGFLLA